MGLNLTTASLLLLTTAEHGRATTAFDRISQLVSPSAPQSLEVGLDPGMCEWLRLRLHLLQARSH